MPKTVECSMLLPWVCIIGLLLSFAAVAIPAAESEDSFPAGFEERVKELVDAVVGCREVVGLSLVVVKGDATYTGAWGWADLENNAQVTPDTLFGVGPLAEAFTTTLLGKILKQ
jgi:CubicO group peptidase (beta-lactamase class C family)